MFFCDKCTLVYSRLIEGQRGISAWCFLDLAGYRIEKNLFQNAVGSLRFFEMSFFS
jgi:hypothetical protein